MTNLDGIQPNIGKGNNDITPGVSKSFAIVPIVSTVAQPQYKNFQPVINGSVVTNSGILVVNQDLQHFFDAPPATRNQLNFVRQTFGG